MRGLKRGLVCSGLSSSQNLWCICREQKDREEETKKAKVHKGASLRCGWCIACNVRKPLKMQHRACACRHAHGMMCNDLLSVWQGGDPAAGGDKVAQNQYKCGSRLDASRYLIMFTSFSPSINILHMLLILRR